MRLVLVGAGNIMNTRHLPALRSQSHLFDIAGVIDRSGAKAQALAEKTGARHWAVCSDPKSLSSVGWIDSIDAAIVATPPFAHDIWVDQLLSLGKHVLVEKPFVIDPSVGESLVQKASSQGCILALNHNFQFSRSFQALDRLLAGGKLGAVRSFYSVQFSNDTRRLPTWTEQLPLGLFYDESPHVFYLLRRFGKSDPLIQSVSCLPSKEKPTTPQILNIQLSTAIAPAHIYINFESAVCEWYFVVFGESHVANVDMFRDILTVLPNDGQHLMKEVLRTSVLLTWHHWKGFVSSGVRYFCGKLFYGMDVTQRKFHDAVRTGNRALLQNMDGDAGVAVNKAQHDVIRLALDSNRKPS